MQKQINIHDYLPHRKPFLMVDQVLFIDSNNVTTSFKITNDNLFNDNGYFAEVGLIENAAQNCSAIMGQTYFIDVDEESNEIEGIKVIGFISTIKKVNVLKLPKVNTTIFTKSVLKSKFVQDNYIICTMETTIFDELDEVIFTSEINLFIQEQK